MTCSLDDIGRKYGTDKSSAVHNYLAYYEKIFAPWRNEDFDLLEIGVSDGASIRTWHEYFPRARIIGVDIYHANLNDDLPRFVFAHGSQGDLRFIRSLLNDFDFRIVIDDGSHFWNHQIFTFESIFPVLRENSIYICEDVQTGYGEMAAQYRHGAQESAASYFLRIAERMAAGPHAEDIDAENPRLQSMAGFIRSLTFIRECVIATN